eukprot:8750492-Karenia_brevis.AAC.1
MFTFFWQHLGVILGHVGIISGMHLNLYLTVKLHVCHISRRLGSAGTLAHYKQVASEKGKNAAKAASIDNMVRLDKCWRETFGWGAEKFKPEVRIEWGKPLTWVLHYAESSNCILTCVTVVFKENFIWCFLEWLITQYYPIAIQAFPP